MFVGVSFAVCVMRLPRGGLRNGHDETAVLHTLEANETAREPFDLSGFTADDEDFKAGIVVEMRVAGGDDEIVLSMLQLGELFSNAAGMVIVDEGDGADNGSVGRRGAFSNEAVANEIAKGLRAIGITALCDGAIEAPQKVGVECNADSAEYAHGHSEELENCPLRSGFRVTRIPGSYHEEEEMG